MLKLDWLQTFSALCETRNLGRTAERIHRTQPAVSQQLANLETHLGMTLYDRAASAPTPAGELLYSKAQRLLASTADVERALADFNDATLPLRIGTNDTSALFVLPDAIRRFRASSPGSPLDIDCAPTAEVVAGVSDNRLDLGVVTACSLPDELERTTIARNRLRLVVSKHSPLRDRKRVSLASLATESWVLLTPDTTTGAVIESYFRKHNFVPQRALTSSSFEVIKRYVSEGAGLGIVPEHALSESDELHAIALTGAPQLETIAIWPRARYQTNSARRFLQELGVRD